MIREGPVVVVLMPYLGGFIPTTLFSLLASLLLLIFYHHIETIWEDYKNYRGFLYSILFNFLAKYLNYRKMLHMHMLGSTFWHIFSLLVIQLIIQFYLGEKNAFLTKLYSYWFSCVVNLLQSGIPLYLKIEILGFSHGTRLQCQGKGLENWNFVIAK